MDESKRVPLTVLQQLAYEGNLAELAFFFVLAVTASKAVALSGLECYEGLQITGDSGRDEIVVAGLMQRVHDVALDLGLECAIEVRDEEELSPANQAEAWSTGEPRGRVP